MNHIDNRQATPAQQTAALAAGALLIVAFTSAALPFVSYDELGGFSDSVAYLIMAKFFSPYVEPSGLIQEAFLHEHYPPLFPLLLALTGGAESYLRAHQVVLLCYSGALILFGLLTAREMRSVGWSKRTIEPTVAGTSGQSTKWAMEWGVIAVTLGILVPTWWLHVHSILSENLYLLLTLATLLLASLRGREPAGWGWIAAMTLLLTAVLATRSIGVALLLGYAAVTLLARRPLKEWIPFAIAALLNALWLTMRPSAGEHIYLQDLLSTSGALSGGEQLLQLLQQIGTNAAALLEGWQSSLLLYWTEPPTARLYVVQALFALGVLGALIRLAKNHLDGWYTLFYLLILLLWPYPDHMLRFLFPLVPLLLLQGLYLAAEFGARLFRAHPKRRARWRFWSPFALSLLLIALTLPSLGFLLQRYNHPAKGSDFDLTQTGLFYRFVERRDAETFAAEFLVFVADVRRLGEDTPATATIAWYPLSLNYLALLSERKGVPLYPPEHPNFTASLERSDYIYLSRVHPRASAFDKAEVDIETWLRQLLPVSESAWLRIGSAEGKPYAVLLKVDKARVAELAKK